MLQYFENMQGGQAFGLFLSIILIIWGWTILNNKNRGAGYYVLLVLFPLIGFIVALCLKNLEDEEEELPPSNDITNDVQ